MRCPVSKICREGQDEGEAVFLSLVLSVLPSVARRRPVTQWIRAAQISDNFRQVFYHMPGIGRKGVEMFEALLEHLLEKLGAVC